jgi:hypothetical protein
MEGIPPESMKIATSGGQKQLQILRLLPFPFPSFRVRVVAQDDSVLVRLREFSGQIRRLRLTQKTRQTTLRMTATL